MVRKKEIITQGQILPVFIIILAIIAYNCPRFSDLIVYDRQAILRGELWRLLTAPLVHFSASHIFWDVVVFGIAGFAINLSGFRNFWLVCSFATILPSVIFLLALPEIERYGGLSGLATGAVAYFCLCSLYKSPKNKSIWLAILAVMGTKILIEATMGVPIFTQADRIPFHVLPSAHIAGFLGALATIMGFCPNNDSNEGYP